MAPRLSSPSMSAALRQIRIAPAFPMSTVVVLTHRGPGPELPAVAVLREAFLRVAPALEGRAG